MNSKTSAMDKKVTFLQLDVSQLTDKKELQENVGETYTRDWRIGLKEKKIKM